ncbi:MAG TPA: MerR family transcriptional regulator, partial [Erysipelotrichaceae bacterium]|nr:MerR family transcriptional regulator [Erysipelotrichaceae bacterium]
KDSAMDFIKEFNNLSEEILQLKNGNVPVESDRCQKLTKNYWDLIVEFTDGDMSMLPKLFELSNFETASDEWEKKRIAINEYLGPALGIYFSRLGINPFEGG